MERNKRIAIYYLLLKFSKELIDKEFASKYEPRAKLSSESFEEYDDYLSNHLQAYEQMLIKQGLGATATADINFYSEIQSVVYDKKDGLTNGLLFQALKEYDFQDEINRVPFTMFKYNWFTQIYLFFYSVLGMPTNDEHYLMLYIGMKKNNILSKLSKNFVKRNRFCIDDSSQIKYWEKILNKIYN
jgi:hypothetical protein